MLLFSCLCPSYYTVTGLFLNPNKQFSLIEQTSFLYYHGGNSVVCENVAIPLYYQLPRTKVNTHYHNNSEE